MNKPKQLVNILESFKKGDINIDMACGAIVATMDRKKPEQIVVWTRRHINNTVWVIATDRELEIDKLYEATLGSEFPTDKFKVHDRWKPDSLYRYVVTEILN